MGQGGVGWGCCCLAATPAAAEDVLPPPLPGRAAVAHCCTLLHRCTRCCPIPHFLVAPGVGQGGGLGAAGAAAPHHRHPHLTGRQVSHCLWEPGRGAALCNAIACLSPGGWTMCGRGWRRHRGRQPAAAMASVSQLPGRLPKLPSTGSSSSPTGCAATLPRCACPCIAKHPACTCRRCLLRSAARLGWSPLLLVLLFPAVRHQRGGQRRQAQVCVPRLDR